MNNFLMFFIKIYQLGIEIVCRVKWGKIFLKIFLLFVCKKVQFGPQNIIWGLKIGAGGPRPPGPPLDLLLTHYLWDSLIGDPTHRKYPCPIWDVGGNTAGGMTMKERASLTWDCQSTRSHCHPHHHCPFSGCPSQEIGKGIRISSEIPVHDQDHTDLSCSLQLCKIGICLVGLLPL